jgi:hypothetical protein
MKSSLRLRPLNILARLNHLMHTLHMPITLVRFYSLRFSFYQHRFCIDNYLLEAIKYVLIDLDLCSQYFNSNFSIFFLWITPLTPCYQIKVTNKLSYTVSTVIQFEIIKVSIKAISHTVSKVIQYI